MDFLTKKRQHNSNKKVFQNLFLESKQSKCMKKQKRKKKRKNKQKTVKNFQIAWEGKFQVYQRRGRNIFLGAGYHVGFVVYL